MFKFGHPCEQDNIVPDTERYVFHFDNNLGASVIRGPFTYGHEHGKWELAILRFNSEGQSDLVYEEDLFTDDDCAADGAVCGWLDEDAVEALLDRIKGGKK